ncbi:ABC-2 family transporter protein [Streptomyces sp. NPDC005395]|uniref:ABC transporter permease n=2 Tax=Streptomyces TaxID=1883 RepID=A0ABV9WPM2_9ACTN|nr:MULTISPECIES: ABC-2 family transporter protein [Streptomyces]MYS55168.1 ABC transporter permease [Streptomyces sp. SID6013]WSU05271.1 ABC-2 family transporter protein [Streptomyces sp. NBC_01124]AZM79269.1 ABC transporter permease [Streptomyces sp. KPB2]MBH5130507.1 ABC-2 family transporter protein [Streptomyces sp. HB-N217]MBQ0965107.1 ABC-2 family transporter protein [Streptomyces sp. RK74B]
MSARSTAARYARLSWFLGGVGLHRLTAYRLDFLLGAGAFLVRVGVQTAVVGLVFRQVPVVGGWSYHEVVFLLGFSLLPRGLDHLFTDQLWELSRKLVQRGEFYRHLVRPVSPLFSLLSERFLHPDGFGELIVGAALVGWSGSHLDLDLTATQWALAPLFVLCGALIHSAVKLLFASLSFWTVTSLPAMYAANQVSEFTSYPLDIYHPTLRALLTWVLPFAFTSYVPCTYLLTGDTGLVVWLPVVTAGAVALALAVWRRGLTIHDTTGS